MSCRNAGPLFPRTGPRRRRSPDFHPSSVTRSSRAIVLCGPCRRGPAAESKPPSFRDLREPPAFPGVGSGREFEVLGEEREDALPGVAGGRLVVAVGTVTEEAVARVFVDDDLAGVSLLD